MLCVQDVLLDKTRMLVNCSFRLANHLHLHARAARVAISTHVRRSSPRCRPWCQSAAAGTGPTSAWPQHTAGRSHSHSNVRVKTQAHLAVSAQALLKHCTACSVVLLVYKPAQSAILILLTCGLAVLQMTCYYSEQWQLQLICCCVCRPHLWRPVCWRGVLADDVSLRCHGLSAVIHLHTAAQQRNDTQHQDT
jgi:hypothetical protein